MPDMKNMTDTLQSMKDRVDQIKGHLRDTISNMPDNPDIKRIAPRCFTMTIANLSKQKGFILSPEFHDFKVQAEMICKHIDKLSFESVIKFLQEIVDTSKHRFPDQRHTMTFHPDVVKYIKTELKIKSTEEIKAEKRRLRKEALQKTKK